MKQYAPDVLDFLVTVAAPKVKENADQQIHPFVCCIWNTDEFKVERTKPYPENQWYLAWVWKCH